MNNHQLEEFVQKHRDEFDDLEPREVIFERIQQQLSDEDSGSQKLRFLNYRIMSVAAVILLLLGLGIVWLNQKEGVTPPKQVAQPLTRVEKAKEEKAPVAEVSKTIPVKGISREPAEKKVTAPERKVQDGNVYLTNLTDMSSASRRYDAVSKVAAMKKIDYDIVRALINTMNTDPSTNVRLAALEALGRFSGEPYVKKQLIKSLNTQKDPTVQIALIDELSRTRSENIVRELKKLTEDQNANMAVKDQAYQSLVRLSSL